MEMVARLPWLATRTRFSSSWLRNDWNGREAGVSKKTLNTLISGGRFGGACRLPTRRKVTGSAFSIRAFKDFSFSPPSPIERISGCPGRRASVR